MRLEFYRRGRGLVWDLHENGFSLLGENYPLRDHACGFFLSPAAVREHEDAIDHLPLTRREAVDWLFAAGLLEGVERAKVRTGAQTLLDLARERPDSFPPSITAVLGQQDVRPVLARSRAEDGRSLEEQMRDLAVERPEVLDLLSAITVSDID